MGKRQDAGDESAALGDQIMSGMAERPFDNPPPAGKVKERPARMSEHELVPGALVAGPERPYSEAGL